MMIFAAKGNKQRRIDEASIQKYADQGYTIIDEKGTVLKESVPTDLTLLKTAFIEHTNKIKMLEAEVSTLKAQLTEATSKKEDTGKKKSNKSSKSDLDIEAAQ